MTTIDDDVCFNYYHIICFFTKLTIFIYEFCFYFFGVVVGINNYESLNDAYYYYIIIICFLITAVERRRRRIEEKSFFFKFIIYYYYYY
jgi:hypothetical protein